MVILPFVTASHPVNLARLERRDDGPGDRGGKSAVVGDPGVDDDVEVFEFCLWTEISIGEQ